MKRPKGEYPIRVMVLADVPVWVLPGLEHLSREGHYATWLKSLVPEFEHEHDIELHWVTFTKETQKKIIHRAYGQTFYIFPRWKKLLSMLTGYYCEVRRVKKLCREISPSLIHAWGSEDVYGWSASRLNFHGPKIFTLQGCLTQYLRLLGGSALFRLQTAYEKVTIRHFNQATAESPAAAELLKEIQPKLDVSIIDYGVDLLFHEQIWDPCKKPTLIWVGAVTERKGIRETIKAFSSPELSHVTLEILGDGDLLDEMQSLASDNVKWLGRLDSEEVARRLSQSWCFLMPTYADTGPTVVKEARVVGLPVITSTGAGASCYIEDGKSGYVIQPGDVNAIKSAVLNVTATRERCIEMGHFGWEKTKDHLQSSTTARSFADLYRACLDQK